MDRSLSALAALCAIPFLAVTSLGQNCNNTSVGFTPLSDLGSGTYHGYPGGLYPGGTNHRPQAHTNAGLVLASQVVPRDAAGNPSSTGKIVFLSIGMSNTRNEWQQFMPLAQNDPLRDSHVEVVMGAQGGQAAEDIRDPAAPYWSFVDSQLAAAGATPEQVQAVWFKEANRAPTAPFPQHALGLMDDYVAILQILHDRFSELRLVYMSSRIYAGYAVTNLNPEPWAYESGFSVKWTVEAQIGGTAALNFDPSAGPVEAPWISWGPYTWADGLVPRSDGLIWQCSDFNPDGTHPNPTGSLKVANRILDMCHADPTATRWYLVNQGDSPGLAYCFGDNIDAEVTTLCPCNNFGAPGHGCASSVNPQGALLTATGMTNPDTVVLHASGMPSTTTSLFLKGNQTTSFGIPFGDGVRCIDGQIIRMGTKMNVNGMSRYPEQDNQPISVRGQTPPGSGLLGFYQTYYRNAAAFCTPATFNITNGIVIAW